MPETHLKSFDPRAAVSVEGSFVSKRIHLVVDSVIIYCDCSVCIAAHLGCTYSSSLLLLSEDIAVYKLFHIQLFGLFCSFIEYLSVLGARDTAVNKTEKLPRSGTLHFESKTLN